MSWIDTSRMVRQQQLADWSVAIPAAGIIQWGPPVDRVLQRGKLTVEQIRDTSHTYLTSMLIKGRPSSGKTALAVEIARTSDFPFIKVISPRNMIGYHETSKCQAIKKVSLYLPAAVTTQCCCCRYLMMPTSQCLAVS